MILCYHLFTWKCSLQQSSKTQFQDMKIQGWFDFPPPFIWFCGSSYCNILSFQVPISIMKFLKFCIPWFLIFHHLIVLIPATSQIITKRLFLKTNILLQLDMSMVFFHLLFCCKEKQNRFLVYVLPNLSFYYRTSVPYERSLQSFIKRSFISWGKTSCFLNFSSRNWTQYF